MIRLIPILIVLACNSALFAAEAGREPEDFRGMKWGISIAEANRMIQEQWNKRRESGEILVSTDVSEQYVDDRTRRLLYRDKVGTVPVGIQLNFLDDRFVNVILTFESKDFDPIDSAFKARYGKPTVERSVPLSNPFGATFMDQQRLWQYKDLRIALTKHADAKTGGASMEKGAWTNYESQQRTLKKEKAAKDL